jgi:hypothetical protein
VDRVAPGVEYARVLKRRVVNLLRSVNAAAAVATGRVSLLVVMLTCAGCLYIPTGEYGYEGADLRKTFGPPDSRRPLRPGVSTRADVLRTLKIQLPTNSGSLYDDPPARADSYVWTLRTPNCRGYKLIFAPPPAGPADTRDYFARVTFDERGLLDSFEVRRETTWRDAAVGMEVAPPQWRSESEWWQIERDAELVAQGTASPPAGR